VSQAKSQLDLDQLSINTIRTLAIDGVQKANSGHPGAPMGLAPVVYELWQRYLRYDPADPLWMNRDRFVLSNGHASMLLYATLHLTGVRDVDGDGNVRPDKPAISMDDLKSFRHMDSKRPGHPDSTLDRQKTFASAVVVILYEDDDHAVRIANNSRYGLSG
jgi:transketolase